METKSLKILLIESDKTDSYLIEACFKGISMFKSELKKASSIKKGRSLLNKSAYDLLIVDPEMPDCSGMSCIEQLEGFQYKIPTIIISGLDKLQTVEMVKLGIQDFLLKDELNAYNLERSIYFSIERFNNIQKVKDYSAAIEVSEQKLLRAQKIAQLGSWELDIETNLMIWSEEMYHIFEVDPKSFSPTLDDFFGFIGKNELGLVSEVFKQSIELDTEFNIDHKIYLAKNKVKYLNTHISGTLPELRDKKVLLGTVQDITQRKEIEKALVKSEDKYSKLFQDSMDGIYITTEEGYFVDFNAVSEEIFGYTKEELMNLHVSNLYADPVERDQFISEISSAGFVRDYEIKIRKRSGLVIDCLLTSRLWKSNDGETHGYQGIVRDITETKKTQELIKAKEIAEKSAEVKHMFLAKMSHEIRTPLNAIAGMTNLLYNTGLSHKQQQFVNSIKTSTDHLVSLVSDVLDFSKIESGHLGVDKLIFNLHDTVKYLIEALKFKAKEKDIDLFSIVDETIPYVLKGDKVKLKQVLINLIINGIKFTNFGHVLLELKTRRKLDNAIIISFSVTDTGIGIHPDKVDSIFDSFTQVSEEINDRAGGTGLGLSIAKELVNLMGGEIHVESKLHKGTVFTFDLELEFANPDEDQKEIRPGESTPRIDTELMQILIAEDNKINQVVLKETIKNWFENIEIDLASNGHEALKRTIERQYDLIVMDVQMPKMNGLEVTKNIRRDKDNLNFETKILALTAFAAPEDVDRCRSIGMNDFMSKPFLPEILYKKVTTLLGISKNIEVKKASSKTVDVNNHKLDLSYLNKLTADDEDLRQRIVSILVHDTPEEVRRMKMEAESKNWNAVRMTAHKLQSTVSFFGNDELQNLVKNMEHNARDEVETEDIPNTIDIIDGMISSVLEQLEADF